MNKLVEVADPTEDWTALHRAVELLPLVVVGQAVAQAGVVDVPVAESKSKSADRLAWSVMWLLDQFGVDR